MKKEVKFLLINPTSPLWRVRPNQRPVNSRFFRFSMLPSLYVAASMPDYVETQIIDEDVETFDYHTNADLIGISFMTFNAPRAYEIADRFRALGKKVIFGGYHPTFMPEEAIQHADAVCIGEAEYNVPKIMADFTAGHLQPFYKSDLVNLEDLPVIDRRMLRDPAYVTLNALQATRGCFHRCEFCTVAPFNRHQFRMRPIGDVLDELKTLGKDVLFMDDNLTLNREYAKELFTRMIPLKKRWYSQCEIGIAEDDELLDLAVKSGCRGLFIGFESLSQESLYGWKKHFNRKKDYLELTRKLHEAGIVIFAAFVFGSDEDGPEVFPNTLEFLLEGNIEVLQSTRLTPFPGSAIYNTMREEGRITDTDWGHYDFFHVVHRPLKMDAETLHRGTAWVQRQFYSYKNMTRRVGRSMTYLSQELVARIVLPMNLGYRIKLSSYGAFKLGKGFEVG